MNNFTEQILEGSQRAGKTFEFSAKDPRLPAQWWFQEAPEGLVLFVVFYSLACRWNRCVGCNLPSKSSLTAVGFRDMMGQVDHVLSMDEVVRRAPEIHKVILSNNGSMLDEETFPSTVLFYLLARISHDFPALEVVSLESRPEYADWEELAMLDRLLREREPQAQLELAIGFEAFDDRLRNESFGKGMPLSSFEKLVDLMAPYGYALKCYFMQKPVPEISTEDAIADIQAGIDYLAACAKRSGLPINMHLNPTYAAFGTPLADAFQRGEFEPPHLKDVVRAIRHARGKRVTIFVGLFDEGLAVPGGSFIRDGDEDLIKCLEAFNRTQDFALLDEH